MSTSGANRQSPLGLFPAQPTPRLYDRAVERGSADLLSKVCGFSGDREKRAADLQDRSALRLLSRIAGRLRYPNAPGTPGP